MLRLAVKSCTGVLIYVPRVRYPEKESGSEDVQSVIYCVGEAILWLPGAPQKGMQFWEVGAEELPMPISVKDRLQDKLVFFGGRSCIQMYITSCA